MLRFCCWFRFGFGRYYCFLWWRGEGCWVWYYVYHTMAFLLFILCFYWDPMYWCCLRVWQVEYAIDLYEYSGRLMEVNIYHAIFCVLVQGLAVWILIWVNIYRRIYFGFCLILGLGLFEKIFTRFSFGFGSLVVSCDGMAVHVHLNKYLLAVWLLSWCYNWWNLVWIWVLLVRSSLVHH